jgi:hypothetical protein
MNDEERADDFPVIGVDLARPGADRTVECIIEQARLEAGHPPTGLKWLRYEGKRIWASGAPMDERDNLLVDTVERQAEEIRQLRKDLDEASPIQVCARCKGTFRSHVMFIEEGDEWECLECYERCNAQERTALSKGKSE